MEQPSESDSDIDLMAQTRELADDAQKLARRLRSVMPVELVPGWVAGAVITALVEELSNGNE